MEIQEPTGIKQMFQSMVPDGPTIIEGRVTRVSPIQITLTNDAKMTLGENSLKIPRHLTNYTVNADISGGSVNGATSSGGMHEHTDGIHDGHAAGDGSHLHTGGNHVHSLYSFSDIGVTVKIYNALKKGEIVYLFSYNSGKQYYVLDRKG